MTTRSWQPSLKPESGGTNGFRLGLRGSAVPSINFQELLILPVWNRCLKKTADATVVFRGGEPDIREIDLRSPVSVTVVLTVIFRRNRLRVRR